MGGSLSLIISYYIASHASRLLYVNYCTVVRDCFIDQNQATAQERAECWISLYLETLTSPASHKMINILIKACN